MYFIRIILVLFNIAFSICHLTFTVNPDCNIDSCDRPWLIHGNGSILQEHVHLMWNAIPNPTFIAAVTHSNTSLNVNWDMLAQMEEDAISFDPPPAYLFALSFQNLILFNDKNDTGSMDGIPPTDIQRAPLSDFTWSIFDAKNESSDGIWRFGFKALAFKGNILPEDCEFSFLVKSFSSFGISKQLPGLITKPLSSEVRVVLKNLNLNLENDSFVGWDANENDTDDGGSKVTPISGFDYPRWALDAVFLSKSNQNSSHETLNFTSHKSLDDEFSPGVFDLNDILIISNVSGTRSYMQWRPISYLTPDDDINHSTYPNVSTLFPAIDQAHINISSASFLNVVFGQNLSDCLGSQTNISFGMPKDGFYTKYNYTDWTISFGTGSPPSAALSVLVITVIIAALGVPLLFLIVGITAAIIIRKRKRKYNILIES